MCYKIRCDGESWKFFGFQSELNKAYVYTHMNPVVVVLHTLKGTFNFVTIVLSKHLWT